MKALDILHKRVLKKRGCHEWTGAKQGSGYGHLRFEKYYSAHRFAYEALVGKIPDGKYILHTCDNKTCVNPAHLYIGTAAQNAKDREDRNRHPHCPGERNGRSILSEDDVSQIRKIDGSYQALAKLFGVSKSTIRDVKKKRTWHHALI